MFPVVSQLGNLAFVVEKHVQMCLSNSHTVVVRLDYIICCKYEHDISSPKDGAERTAVF